MWEAVVNRCSSPYPRPAACHLPPTPLPLDPGSSRRVGNWLLPACVQSKCVLCVRSMISVRVCEDSEVTIPTLKEENVEGKEEDLEGEKECRC